jgi:hypothetical protein
MFKIVRILIQKIRRIPKNIKEEETLETLNTKLDDAEKAYKKQKIHELENLSAAEKAFEKMKEEVRRENELYGEKSKEQILKERQAILEGIRTKLKDLNKGES